jgi:hypothetical protein
VRGIVGKQTLLIEKNPILHIFTPYLVIFIEEPDSLSRLEGSLEKTIILFSLNINV